jgi:hypothetical protein
MVNGRLPDRGRRRAPAWRFGGKRAPLAIRLLTGRQWQPAWLWNLFKCRSFKFSEKSRRICFESGQKARFAANCAFKAGC